MSSPAAASDELDRDIQLRSDALRELDTRIAVRETEGRRRVEDLQDQAELLEGRLTELRQQELALAESIATKQELLDRMGEEERAKVAALSGRERSLEQRERDVANRERRLNQQARNRVS